MLWPPKVTEELRNDVRFALRFKVGRKQQPLNTARKSAQDRCKIPSQVFVSGERSSPNSQLLR
jgi:hypothetical protein